MRLEADIAGVRVAVDAPAPFLSGPLGDRYRRFPAQSGALALTCELVEHHDEGCAAEDWRGADEFRRAMAQAELPEYPLDIERRGAIVDVRSAWFHGSVDLAAGRGHAVACARDPIGAVENFFRVGVAHLLQPQGGFLLHACAVILADGSAVVGFGESGAGKTTLSSLAGARPVVSDDLVALRRDADGRLVVVPAPLRPGGAEAAPRGHRVRALVRLRKAPSPAPRLDPLSPTLGAAALVGSMPFVLDERETADAALAIAQAAAAEPGVAELHFAPVPGVWDSIEEVLP